MLHTLRVCGHLTGGHILELRDGHVLRYDVCNYEHLTYARKRRKDEMENIPFLSFCCCCSQILMMKTPPAEFLSIRGIIWQICCRQKEKKVFAAHGKNVQKYFLMKIFFCVCFISPFRPFSLLLSCIEIFSFLDVVAAVFPRRS